MLACKVYAYLFFPHAANADFNAPINLQHVIATSLTPEIVFSANGDSVSQEGNEVVILRLSSTTDFSNFGFFRDELQITIEDGTRKHYAQLYMPYF